MIHPGQRRTGVLACAFGAALAMAAATPACAETMVTALSTHRVEISSSYTGARLVIFGTIERDSRTVSRADPYDLVVTVRGPRATHIVREKENFGPIWINQTQRRFIDAPSFAIVASNRPLTDILAPEQARRLKLGLQNIYGYDSLGFELDAQESVFRDALIRLKSNEGLVSELPNGATFLSGTLFRAPIELPGNAPPGSYDVEVTLLAGSVPLATQTTNFEVVTTGFDQRIRLVSQRASVTYGLTTIVLALFFGWLASVIFRRD
jgi:uncharacterized protein (TIGR02186 family)